MDARALWGAGLATALTASAAFAACGSPQPHPALAPSAAASAAPSMLGSGVVAQAPSASASAAPPATALAAAVAAARACHSPTTQIVNPPDGGVVFNNAMHRKDAGNIDRLQGVVDAVSANANSFRCCFDVWAAAHPATQGTLLLALELGADGAVKEARVDTQRSTVAEEVTVACVLEVAKATAYPPSPAGHDTLVEYPFVVAGAGAGP